MLKHLEQMKLDPGEMMMEVFMLPNFLCVVAFFICHEERPAKKQLEPNKANGVTSLIGFFVEDVDSVINNALQAGAILLSPAQDYDYGYRQGNILDPFGHQWMIQTKIQNLKV
jgi:uncharacterized glyoxalase superfamily protein PhnB